MSQPKLKPAETSAPSSLFFTVEQFKALSGRDRKTLLNHEEFRTESTLCVKNIAETWLIYYRAKAKGAGG